MSASHSSEAQRPAHLLGEWARLLFATLRDAGVRDMWLSPGSRSTPFAWAAHRTPGLRLRALIDERSAAFLALGHTRITGRPCALLCTSGSAAANYFPAVVEASQAHLPLLVLTADRPLEAQHAGAAQTIDQLKLYGDYARAFFDLGLPDAAPSALSGLRRSVAQAVTLAQGPLPGPVQLNLRARKPLEPVAPETDAERALTAHVTSLLERPITRHAPSTRLANAAVLATARTLSEAASGAIIVGPLPAFAPSLAAPLHELATLLGFPLFAEASSQARFTGENAARTSENTARTSDGAQRGGAAPERHGDHSYPLFDWLLSAPEVAAELRPEVLLCVGATPTSSAFERWAASVPRRIAWAPHGQPDPLGSAELVASGELALALPDLIASIRELRSASPASAPSPTHTPAADPGMACNTNPSAKTPAAESGMACNTNPSAHTESPSAGAGMARNANSSAKSVSPFVARLREAHQQCEQLVERALAEEPQPLTEGAAVRSLVQAASEGSVLALGNSLPIRDVDAYVPRAARLRVVSQRGANGIDGLNSGAIGSAIASGAPTLLLLGDVSFFHDLGGLAAARLVTTPLVIAVIDNAGGRIFDQLPAERLYRGDAAASELWLTPPAAELEHAAQLFRLRYAAPRELGELGDAARAALAAPGVTLLHVRVVPDSAAKMRARVLRELSALSLGKRA